jgi:hypothetical protein
MDVLVEAGDGYTAKQAGENHIPIDTPRAGTAARPYAEIFLQMARLVSTIFIARRAVEC